MKSLSIRAMETWKYLPFERARATRSLAHVSETENSSHHLCNGPLDKVIAECPEYLGQQLCGIDQSSGLKLTRRQRRLTPSILPRALRGQSAWRWRILGAERSLSMSTKQR